ncbi:MYH6_7 [Mytilus edulis]|uniref:MYH6_7 n=1 Tax=Mytilus edulis TaxID=6550 RepID=A0A8S3UVE2_MYTED|nr:MYH6_7 [Mytilus edulis]
MRKISSKQCKDAKKKLMAATILDKSLNKDDVENEELRCLRAVLISTEEELKSHRLQNEVEGTTVVYEGNGDFSNCSVCKEIHNLDKHWFEFLERSVSDHDVIMSSEKYNFEESKIPEVSNLNIDFFKFMLTDYFWNSVFLLVVKIILIFLLRRSSKITRSSRVLG